MRRLRHARRPYRYDATLANSSLINREIDDVAGEPQECPLYRCRIWAVVSSSLVSRSQIRLHAHTLSEMHHLPTILQSLLRLVCCCERPPKYVGTSYFLVSVYRVTIVLATFYATRYVATIAEWTPAPRAASSHHLLFKVRELTMASAGYCWRCTVAPTAEDRRKVAVCYRSRSVGSGGLRLGCFWRQRLLGVVAPSTDVARLGGSYVQATRVHWL